MLVEGQNLSFFNTFFFFLIKTIFSNILEATLAVTCVNLHSYYCHAPSTEAITEITGKLLWHFLSNLFAIRQISTGMGTMQGPYMQGSYVQYPFVQGLCVQGPYVRASFPCTKYFPIRASPLSQ